MKESLINLVEQFTRFPNLCQISLITLYVILRQSNIVGIIISVTGYMTGKQNPKALSFPFLPENTLSAMFN